MTGEHEAPKKTKHAAPSAHAGKREKRPSLPRRSTAGRRMPRRGRILMLAAVCAVGALVIGGGIFALHVHSLDTVFPNIRLDGVPVGGLTRGEALATMRRDAPEGYAGKSVSVSLLDGQTLTVLAQDIGLGGTQEAAVDAAYGYGREGGAVKNAVTYLRCRYGGGVNILWQGAGLDREALDALAAKAAAAANETRQSAHSEILDDRIVVTKGSEAPVVDSAALAQQIENAFLTRDYSDLVYTPQRADEGDLQSLYDAVYVAPTNASYDKTTQSITKESPGVSFDLADAKGKLSKAAIGEKVTIPLAMVQPEVTADALRENLFCDTLAEATLTPEDEDRDVTESLAESVNGTILLPGEEFSLLAGAQEVSGDDFDFFASALYGCALRADLTVTQRSAHKTRVDGWPLGMDAEVRRDGADLCLENGSDWPVRIDAWMENGALRIQLWGTNINGTYITITASGWEDAGGYRVQTRRDRYAADGTLLSSEPEAYSRYDR